MSSPHHNPGRNPADAPRGAVADARRRASGPEVIGRAGTGLEGAPSWAANAEVVRHGLAGERKTAAVLERAVSKAPGTVVLHDLAIPIPGFTANIDHALVSGERVLLIDSKAWAAGFYWTAGGVTRRGLAKFPPADKRTVELAADRIAGLLDRRAPAATIERSIIVVWPTRGRVSMRWATMPGGDLVPGHHLARRASQFLDAPADRGVINVLSKLVNG